MPTSFPENISPILKQIIRLEPKKVLDIGFGRGKYGFLIKEYVHDCVIEGVEVFQPYITDLQKNIYSKIYNDNIHEMKMPKADLYLCIDVIEHWEKEQAINTLLKMVEHGKVLVSIPRTVAPQGAEYGNEWERHISSWLEEDFEQDFKVERIFNDISFIMILCRK